MPDRTISQPKPIEVHVLKQSLNHQVKLRREVTSSDVQAVREISTSTGFFSPEEISIAIELIEDRLEKGEQSDYRFIFADVNRSPVGFGSFGPVPCTQASFDLYWIAVHKDHHRKGIGRRVMDECERLIANEGGRRIYVETSSRSQYEPTRRFYERCGYRVDAVQDDFYAPGDGKVTLVKALQPQ